MTDHEEQHRIDCLVRWVVDHHDADYRKIKRWFEKIRKRNAPVSRIPGLSKRVHQEYLRRNNRGNTNTPSPATRSAAMTAPIDESRNHDTD